MVRQIGIILFFIFFICGVVVANQEGKKETKEEPWIIVIDELDPVDDDNGPGTYLYPTHKQFSPHQGIFDLQHFKVEGKTGLIRFHVTFGEITNPWKAPFGFSHQLIQIYIDHKPGGSRYPFTPGANVVFSPKAPWDTLIKATGFGMYLYHETDTIIDNQPYTDGKVRVLADCKTIEIELPMGEWITLEDLRNASFYVFIGGQDGFGPDNFRVVKSEVSEWYFSGGDDLRYTPNIIDILTPRGKSQKKILGSYDSKAKILAVVEPVTRPNLIRTGLVYAISVLIGLLLWFGWRKWEGMNRTSG